MYDEIRCCERFFGERNNMAMVREEQHLACRCHRHEAAQSGSSAVVIEIDEDVIEHNRHRPGAVDRLFDRSQTKCEVKRVSCAGGEFGHLFLLTGRVNRAEERTLLGVVVYPDPCALSVAQQSKVSTGSLKDWVLMGFPVTTDCLVGKKPGER